MAGYIGSGASVVSSGAENKKVFDITTNTTSLTGLNYTVGKVHVYHNGVRLVDGTDYTANNSTSITLTVAAVSGDQVVVVSYASFQLSEHYTSAEADAEFVTKTGDTMTGDLNLGANTLSLGANNANSPQILFENSDGVTGDAALSTYDDASGTMLVMGSNFYINSSGSESRFNTSEESSAVMLNRNGDLNLLTGGTGATATTRLKIDSSGNVGIGTSSIDNKINIQESALAGRSASNGNTSMTLEHATDTGIQFFSAGQTQLRFGDASSTGAGSIIYEHATDRLRFATGSSERMRIDSSGRLLVGTTSSSSTISGAKISGNGSITSVVSGNQCLRLNRLSSDGDIIQFWQDSASVGSIGSVNDKLVIGTSTNGLAIDQSSSVIMPWSPSGQAVRDNAIDLGYSTGRFDDIYASNGTIQTSDFNEKQDIASLTATEMLVGKRISALFKTFRWKDSVAKKGDTARTHTGIIAQDVQAAFTAEGLDAGDYSLFISDTWWEHDVDVPAVEAVAEVTDEDGNVTTETVEAKDAYTRTDTYDTEDEAPEGATERTRLGIRYPELLSFVAAYNEQRFASIEARLTALEDV